VLHLHGISEFCVGSQLPRQIAGTQHLDLDHPSTASAGRYASRIPITNIPGADGTISLAQFVTSKKGRGNAVMVTFYVMIGVIAANKSSVTLDDVTLLAQLRGEYELIVLSADYSAVR